MAGARRIPLSTYRLQFNSRFTFRDAHAIVDYLDTLGVSDCYASSYLKAVPGSPHGYDVADPTCLNPDVGTDDEYWRWIDALKSRGMGHVMDLVPNHMGIAKSANPWWLDVLENGAELALRALLRHRVASGQGRAGRKGPHPDPRRSVR